MTPITLRRLRPKDLPIFFTHQQDAAAVHMAAFTAKDPSDRAAFDAHWQRILSNPAIDSWTIEVGEAVVGHVISFVMEGERAITYWIDRAFWGQGIATGALQLMLEEQAERPLFARVATDNIGSQRVLQKCGFEQVGTDSYYANARGAEIAEYVYRLGE